MVSEPRRVAQPLVRRRSLIATGTPSSGDSGLPSCQRASDASASAMEASWSTRQKELMLASSASIRPRQASAASTGDASPAR